MAEGRGDSILAVDFGSAHTRAFLFALVDGEYAMVARRQGRTSIDAPQDNVGIGLGRLLREMGAETERRFLDDDGELIKPEQDERVGVDTCVTTASAGRPIRVVTIALLAENGEDAVSRALMPYYVDIVARIHLEDGLSDMARLNRLVESRPDLLFISGGTDGGARGAMLKMLDLARQAVSAMPSGARPTVLYAGNRDVADDARESLGQLVEVLTAPNIRPGLGSVAIEPTQAILARYFDEFRRRNGGGFQQIGPISDSGIMSSARGFEMMAAYLARMLDAGALAIDIGAAKSLLCVAEGGGVRTSLRSDIGMGSSAAETLALAGEEAMRSWLPFRPRKGELAQYTAKKSLRSVDAPLDMRERYIEYALLRAGIRLLLEDVVGSAEGAELAGVGLVLVGGATIAGSGHGALDMLLLSEALPLDGALQFLSDRHGVLPSLGALASVEPTAVVQLLQSGVVEHVGSLIKASGRAAAGKRAMKVSAKLEGEVIGRDIAAGDVWHLPAAPGVVVDVSLQTGRGVRVGGKRRMRLRLRGGRGGILFDARLTSASAGETVTERTVNMLRWYAAVTGDDKPVMVPESWLGESES